MPKFGRHMPEFGWIYDTPPCADFAPKEDFKRGRTRRRVLRWLKARSNRKLPVPGAALPRGVRVEVDRHTGYAYVAPVPNKGPYDDLGAARGVMFAVLLSIPLWLAVWFVARSVYGLIFG